MGESSYPKRKPKAISKGVITYGRPPSTADRLRPPDVPTAISPRRRRVDRSQMQLKQDGVSWHLVGDDIVVLDLNGSMYLKLSGSGRVLWERLAEPAEEADLSAALVETYGIDTDRAATDVAAFVADLRRRDLLVE
jgi:hypothetical protein